jgi:hypothetical protein
VALSFKDALEGCVMIMLGPVLEGVSLLPTIDHVRSVFTVLH